MESRLVAIEIERCNILAALADEELREAVRLNSFGPECLAKREARRALEKGLQHAIPQGPWDYDIDEYPAGKDYTVDLDDGYGGILRRAGSTWTWLAYIRLPAGHCCIGKDYDDLHHRWTFPHELTYGPSSWEHRSADLFGIDHGSRCDLAPHHHFLGYAEDKWANTGTYTTYAMAVEKLRELKTRFQELEAKHREEILGSA
jgi:hypothetical protein